MGGIDEYTELCIHSDTTDDSTTFVDSSNAGHGITPNGDVHHETDQSYFGSSSMQFDGTGDYLAIAALEDIVDSSLWTIDFWVRLTSHSAFNNMMGCLSVSNVGWGLSCEGTGKMRFIAGAAWRATTTLGITLNTWTHIACVKDGVNGLRIAINGVFSGTPYTGSIGKYGTGVTIGSMYSLPVSWFLYGYLDEFRVSVGSARWTSDFTPPTVPYSMAIESGLFTLSTLLSSDLQMGVSTDPLALNTSLSSTVFGPAFFLDSQPLQLAGSLNSDLQVDLSSSSMTCASSLSSSLRPTIAQPAFVQTSVMQIPTLFSGWIIVVPAFQLSSSLSSDLLVGLSAPALSLSTALSSTLLMQLYPPALTVTAALNAVEGTGEVVVFTTRGAGVYYLFSLTKVSGIPDIEIPISSFQSRLRNGTPSYLSVVIPGLDYSGAISVRADADMVVEMAYKRNGSYIQREEIARVTLENIMIHQGPNNQSITLSGHRTNTYTAKGFRTRQSPIYYGLLADGARARYRFPRADFDLNPGDTFTVGADVFTAGLITYIIGSESQQMEVIEANG